MAVVDRSTKGEKTLHGINLFVLALLTVIFFYPLWHCLMASFSDPTSLVGYKGLSACRWVLVWKAIKWCCKIKISSRAI